MLKRIIFYFTFNHHKTEKIPLRVLTFRHRESTCELISVEMWNELVFGLPSTGQRSQLMFFPFAGLCFCLEIVRQKGFGCQSTQVDQK